MEIVAPIVLSLLAGSATGVGGFLVLAFGEVNERLIGFFMGFAGGVMLVVSFLRGVVVRGSCRIDNRPQVLAQVVVPPASEAS